MVDLTLLQSVSYIAGALGVCVAAIYYVMNLRISQRNQQLSLQALEQSAKAQELGLKTQELALKSQQQNLETRQAQLFMQIYLRYLEPDLFSDNLPKLFKRSWKGAEDYWKKYETEKDGGNLNMMMAFYEGIAVLVNRGMLDIGLVYEIMPTNVTAFWGRYGTLIKEMRTMGYPPRLYCLVEELSDKLTEYAKKKSDQIVTDYTAAELRPSNPV
ncbi:MAG: DUF4760 domain-containing protein [Candidatus Bathyarchaeia archaeon]|jgi:hypothetical protein